MSNQCKEIERKLQIIGIFLKVEQPYKLWQKRLDRIQNRTGPRYSYNKSVYQISFQYVQPVQKKMNGNCKLLEFFGVQGPYNSGKNG
jgi:hypothetical protein